MIVSGANGTNHANGTNNFIQKIYFLNDKPDGLQTIKIITLNGTAQAQNYIPIFTSPQLTKMGYSYVPAGSSAQIQIFPKSVDYTNGQVIDMLFDNPTHYYRTAMGIRSNSFDFSDYFLIVRNASSNVSVGAVE
jgi:hypothetical protein